MFIFDHGIYLLPVTEAQFKERLGSRLKRLRTLRRDPETGLAAPWTQEALAAAAHVETSTVARIERGEMMPSLWIATKLAAALRSPLAALDLLSDDAAS